LVGEREIGKRVSAKGQAAAGPWDWVGHRLLLVLDVDK